MTNDLSIKVLKMKAGDVSAVTEIHKEAFPRERCSREWVKANFVSYPKTICYVAVIGGTIAGFIFWEQKGGFRKEVVLELEQIAVGSPSGVLPSGILGTGSFRGKGVGGKLIKKSLLAIEKYLAKQRRKIKCVLVTTRKDNKAQELYRKVLGAKVEAVIKDLYSADEVVMVARRGRN